MIVHLFFTENEIYKIMNRINDLKNRIKADTESEKAILDKEIDSLKNKLLSISIRA